MDIHTFLVHYQLSEYEEDIVHRTFYELMMYSIFAMKRLST